MTDPVRTFLTDCVLRRAEILGGTFLKDEAIELIVAVRAVEPQHHDVQRMLLIYGAKLTKLVQPLSYHSSSIKEKYYKYVDQQSQSRESLSSETMDWYSMSLSDREICILLRSCKKWRWGLNTVRAVAASYVAFTLSILIVTWRSAELSSLTFIFAALMINFFILIYTSKWRVSKWVLAEEKFLIQPAH